MSNEEPEMNAGPEGSPAPLDAGSDSTPPPPQPAPEAVAAAPAKPAAAETPGLAAVEQRSANAARGPVRRFIRSVISHLVFAAIVTAVVVGYLYQREILNRVGDELCTEDRLGGYMTKPVRPLATGGEQAAAPALPAAAAPASAEPAASAPAQSQLPTKSEPAKAGPAPQPAPAQQVSAPHEGAEAEAVADHVSAPAAPVALAPASADSGAASPVAAPAASASPPGGADAFVSEWQAARQAYAARKPEAGDLYRELVAKHPVSASLRGEYGNVLYAMGNTKEAAEQYYEAALQQLKGTQPELAACMEDVVARLDAGRAEMLREKITQPCPYKADRSGTSGAAK